MLESGKKSEPPPGKDSYSNGLSTKYVLIVGYSMGLKITKRNPSVFIEQTNPEPVPPFYSHVFVSPQKSPKQSLVSQSSVHKSWLGSPSPSRTAIGGTPKMNFSYQSPSQAKR